MELLKLSAQNFCCFEEFEFELFKAGLVWVTGNNEDTKSADNNGSGKSTLFKALTWGLYGQTIDGERGDGIIKSGQSEASVSVLVRDEDTIYTICRKRKPGAPSLGLFNRGEPVELDKKELQAKINDMVGLDYTAFRNTVLYGQNDHSRFADPKTKDSERKDVLHKILGLSVFKLCHEEVRKRRLEARNKLTLVENEMSSCRARIQEQNISDLRERMNQYEDERDYKLQNVLKVYDEVRKELEKENKTKPVEDDLLEKEKVAKNKIIKLKSLLSEYDEIGLTKKISVYERKVRNKKEEIEGHKVTASSISGELKVFEEQCSLLDTTNCPVCNSPLDKGEARKHVGDLLVKTKELKRRVKNHEREIVSRRGDLEKLKLLMEKSEKVLSSFKKLKVDVSRAESKLFSLEQEKLAKENEESASRKRRDELKNKLIVLDEKRGVLQGEKNPYVELLKAALGKVREYRAQLKSLDKKRKKVVTELSHLEFWFHGFSNRGLPSFLLDGVMPILSDRTNHYLEILTDGDIKVEFATQREKKSSKGEYRDEINITWTIEGIVGCPPSGGQLKKIEIATDLALMDLAASGGGRAPDILALDEILDGLDDKGVQRVLILLQELRKKRGSVFVISHDDRMSEIFEKSIVVEKKNGTSVLKEVS